MTIIVEMSNGYSQTVNCAKTEAEAIERAEAEANKPQWVGEERAALLAAESTTGRIADGGYIKLGHKIVALSTRRMREVFIDGGYALIPA